jgi:hypothetical protein
MREMWMTGQTIAVEQIYGIDVALHAAYPGYIGLNYEGGRGLFRLMFSALPDESERLTIAGIVNRAPVFSRKVTNLFERRPTWNQFSR